MLSADPNSKQGPDLDPIRTCDIVMKGGITSGIVYPKTIYEIAKEYRFVNIGGTSAGAIAAALTASAEYNRREFKSIEGFEKLNGLADLLTDDAGGKTRLFTLFQPNKSTKKIFNALIHLAEKKTPAGKIIFSLSSLPVHFPFISLLSILPGALICYFLWQSVPGSGLFWGIFSFTFLCTLILMILSTSTKFVFSFKKLLAKNNFGLTNGNAEDYDIKTPPLTVWLADKIDEMAGIKDKPLTFGDLEIEGSQNTINLQMMTTNLTWRRPHTLPLKNNKFYFDEEEFKKYFPPRISKWIIDKSDKSKSKDGKLPLPDYKDIPVILGVRMSLSFPLLISAVPLYAVDYSKVSNQNNEDSIAAEKCLFSDGGICSNFPIHFFDSPIPGRPTFALNLSSFHSDYPESEDESKNIYLPNRNNSISSDRWFRFSDSIPSFIGAIISTMQNWVDNSQMSMPGYRDRTVDIHLTDGEGGLNLNMDKEIIDKLTTRGQEAGEALRDRFTGNSDHHLNWDNHRWIRFRTTMCVLENYLKSIEEKFKKSNPDIEMSYDELLRRKIGNPPKSYQFTKAQREFAIEEVEELREFIQKLTADAANTESVKNFCDGAPKPAPELRTRPKI